MFSSSLTLTVLFALKILDSLISFRFFTSFSYSLCDIICFSFSKIATPSPVGFDVFIVTFFVFDGYSTFPASIFSFSTV